MKRLTAALLALLLAALCPAAALAAPEGETVIDSEAAFLDFASQCCLESYSKDRVFVLAADLDLGGTDFQPIPYFAGVFRGEGHRITGLKLSGDGSRVGLFRTIAPGAELRDLEVEGTVTPGGTRLEVGGIAGFNAGTIEGCRFSGTVEGLENVGGIAGTNEAGGAILSCSFEGAVRAEHQSGGIAGENRGLIRACRASGGVNEVPITPERKLRFDLSAFTEDDFLDLSNIGGVAGLNSGTIEGCVSEAAVGYAYTGYNVGGIAGKSAGFITACENRGLVRGRRDVGGIVGQLLPHTAWDFSEDRLNGLAEELRKLDEALTAAARSAHGSTEAVREQMDALHGAAGHALDELRGVESYYTGSMTGEPIPLDEWEFNPDTGLPELPGYSLTGADFSGLASALDELYAQSAALSETLSDAALGLSDDLGAVRTQLGRVLDSLDGLLSRGVSEETLFESYDLSADESYAHELGAVDACRNSGAVEAESSAGGIAGSMAYELSFDMEDRLSVSELISSDAKRYVFAVLRGCESRADVSVRDSNAGGVVGRAELGAVVDCVVMGAVSAQKGDYVGGVAGSSGGSILSCWARAELSGGKYLGGIAGSGQNILRCAAWTELRSGTEYLGAVAGFAGGEVRENRYAESRPAGIDGVSLTGQCEPVSVQELLALEGAPADFGLLQLRFLVEGRVLETVTLPFGGSIRELPAVPDDGARRWRWDEFDRTRITRSMDVTGSYLEPLTVLSTGEDFPLFLAEGEFAEGQSLRAEPVATDLPEEDVIAAYRLTVDGYDGSLTVHMRAGDGGRLCVLESDGTLRELSYETVKSYLVFPLDNGAALVYLRQSPAAAWLPWAGAVGGAVLLAAAIILLLRRGKARKSRGGEQDGE